MFIVTRFRSLSSFVLPQRCPQWDFHGRGWLSLTPEFKTRFHFPLERLDQILDGTYSRERGWMAKWKAYLEQFHKLRIGQIKDMLFVCAKRRAIPRDLLAKLRSVHWTSKLSEGSGSDLASIVHSLAILTTTKQHQRRIDRSEKFLENVLRHALFRDDLNAFHPIALSQCLYAFALLDLKGHSLINVYSSAATQSELLGQFNTQSLANILWSLGKLNHSNLAFVDLLSKEMMSKLKEANEQQLCNVIWSWGILQYRHRAHWSMLLSELKLRQNQLTGQGLATLMMACGRIRFQDLPTFRELLQNLANTKKLILMNSQALANIVWSLGKVQYPTDDPYLIALAQEATKPSRLVEYSDQELCCLATGLYHLDYQEINSVRCLQEEVKNPKRLASFKSLELCTFIWCFGKMSVNSEPLQRSLSRELIQRNNSLLELSNKELCLVVIGWAHCLFPVREDTNIVFREAMKQSRLEEYTSQEIANLIWAFGRLKVHSIKIYSRLAERLYYQDHLKSFSLQALANILVGWAHGRFQHIQLITQVAKEIIDRESFAEMKEQELANTCWALGKLRFEDPAILKPLALEVVRNTRLKNFTPQQLSSILLGWSKSSMHEFELWDKIVREFSTRNETLVLDLPVFHNVSLAMKNAGFKGLSNYRNHRERHPV